VLTNSRGKTCVTGTTAGHPDTSIGITYVRRLKRHYLIARAPNGAFMVTCPNGKVENYSPGDARRLGLDPKTVRRYLRAGERCGLAPGMEASALTGERVTAILTALRSGAEWSYGASWQQCEKPAEQPHVTALVGEIGADTATIARHLAVNTRGHPRRTAVSRGIAASSRERGGILHGSSGWRRRATGQ